jgi:hypothetical protein
MRTVRSFATEDRCACPRAPLPLSPGQRAARGSEADRFATNLIDILTMNRHKSLVAATAYAFLVFCIWGAAALAFWYGGTLVQARTLTVGDVVTGAPARLSARARVCGCLSDRRAVFGMMLIGVLGLGQAAGQFGMFMKAGAAGSLVFAVIERQPRVPVSVRAAAGGNAPRRA